MELILVGIGIIICIAVIISIVSSGNAERKRKEEAKRNKRTGFSSFTFKLRGSNYCSDISKDFLKNIKVNDAVLLMPEFFNEYDKYAISVRYIGKHIGYVDRTTAYHWAEKLFTGSDPNYQLCVAKSVTINEGYDFPLVEFEVFYRDFYGEAKIDLKHFGPYYAFIDPIAGCGKDLSEDLTKRGFIYVEESKEIINTHPEWYDLIEGVDEDLKEKWRNEDIKFLKWFIQSLYTGIIVDGNAKSRFLKQAATDRIYGNNEKLEKLLDRYLEFKELSLK